MRMRVTAILKSTSALLVCLLLWAAGSGGAAELPKDPDKLTPAQAVDAYLAVAEDEQQTRVRRNYAVMRMAELGQGGLTRIKQLYAGAKAERRGILADVVGAMKNPGTGAVQMLLEDLKGSGLEVHPNVIRALADLEVAEASPVLLALLPRVSDETRPVLLHTLGRLADERAADVLLAAFDSEDRLVRTISADGAIRLLVRLRSKAHSSKPDGGYAALRKKALEYADHGEREDVRRILVSGFARVNDPEAAPLLRRLLRTGPPSLRTAAAETLGKLKDTRSVSGLTEALYGDDPVLRRKALGALAAIGDVSCVPVLIDRLEVSSPKERRDVVRALQRLTRQAFGDNPAQWRLWWRGRG